MLLLLQNGAKTLKLVLNFPRYGPHKTTLVGFEILNFRLLPFFFFFFFFFCENFNFNIVAYGEIKNLNYLDNERS